MFSAFERLVAMRYLRARRQEGFISVIAGFSLLGIGLGVATLIIVMSVMNGFRHELMGRILGLNGHLTVSANAASFDDFDNIAGLVKAVEGVVSVTPIVDGQVMVAAGTNAVGALVRGLRPEDIRGRAIIAGNIRSGSLDRFQGPDVVAIGQRMAERMNLPIGGKVTLISPQGTTTVLGTVPRMKTYEVVAVFEVGMFEYDSSFVFMPLEAAQLFFRHKNAVTDIEIMVADPGQVTPVARAIQESLGTGFRLLDWQRANSSFFTAIQVERNVMFLILTLIILVAAFNIISGQIMLVKDKGRDIAILRTMGATRGMILRIFLLSGASIGIVGTGAGVLIGLLFCNNIEGIRRWLEGLTNTKLFAEEIYFLSKLPAIVDPVEVASIVAMALGLSLLATIYPSWRAARLDPVEALRYE